MKKDHMRKALLRITRGYQTIDSYWKQNINDGELNVIRNELYAAIEDLEAYIEDEEDD